MTNRVPYTVPPEIGFPEPLTNPSDPRLKHRLQPWQGQETDVMLIGVPFDEGVALGGGRPGAARGPSAFREALQRLGTTYDAEHGIDFDHLRLADAGDLEVMILYLQKAGYNLVRIDYMLQVLSLGSDDE